MTLLRWGAFGVGLLLLLAAGSMIHYALATGERVRFVDPNDFLFLEIQRVEDAPSGNSFRTLVHGRVDGERTPVTLKLTGSARSGRFVGERLPVYATGIADDRFVTAADYHGNLPLWHVGGMVVATPLLAPAAIAIGLGGVLLWLSRLARRAAARRAARRPVRTVAASAGRLVANDRREAAEDECRLTMLDSFAPHGTPPATIKAVIAVLASRPEVRSAWLVRKRATHFAETDPFFVLAVEIRGWRAKRRRMSLAWLGENIVLPGRGVVTTMARDSRWLFRRLQHDGAVPIYQNL